MDKERSRDVMRVRSSGSCFSPTKRQQMRRSSPIVIGENNSGGGRERNATMRWKKEKIRGSRWKSSNNKAVAEVGVGGGSEGEEGDAFHSPHITSGTGSLASRKRVRIHGKVSEDCDSVDPTPVPRKLRSAINKQTSKSASPPLPVGKKKRHIAFDGMQEPSYNCGRTSKASLLHGFLTKDEEDVAEALFELARRGMGKSVDKLDTKAASTSYSEDASKEEDTKLLLSGAVDEGANISACLEEPPESTEKVEPPSSEQTAMLSQSLLTVEGNPKGEQKENLSSGIAMCFPNSLGFSALNCSDNGAMEQTKSDLLPHRAEIVLFRSTESDVLHEEQQAKQTSENESALQVRRGLPSTSHGHLDLSSPNNVAICPDSDTSVAKLSLINSGARSCRKKCATHVYVSHLIQMYQSKSKEGSKPALLATCDTAGTRDGFNCTSSAASSSTFMKRKRDDAKSHMLNNVRYLPVQPSSTSHDTHAEQMMGMAYDFLPFSAGQRANNSGNRRGSSEAPHSPFLHPQSQHHPNVPFPFPHVPYTHPYPDNLASSASQQVQLRVPQYMGNPYYRPHMNLPEGSTKLQVQQQLWQSYLAQHRPPVGYGLPSSRIGAQASSPISPGTSGHYRPSNIKRQQLPPDGSISSSSVAEHHQEHYRHTGVYDSVAFHQDGSSQLQLLCNVQRS